MGGPKAKAISAEGEVVTTPSLRMVDEGVSMVHFVVWKFIFIAITMRSLYGTQVSALDIHERAQKRVRDRLSSLKVRLRTIRIKAQAKEKAPNYRKERKWVAGLGEISVDGEFQAYEAFDLWLT